MLVKVAILFLALIAVVGWIGTKLGRLRLPFARSARCPACGRPKVGRGPCPCGRA